MTQTIPARSAALIALMAAVLASGASPGAVAADKTPGADSARLVFFRQPSALRGDVVALVKIDGKAAGELVNGSQLVAHAPPGQPTVEINGELDFGLLSFPLQVQPGQEYFLQVTGQPPAGIGRPFLAEWLAGRPRRSSPSPPAGWATIAATPPGASRAWTAPRPWPGSEPAATAGRARRQRLTRNRNFRGDLPRERLHTLAVGRTVQIGGWPMRVEAAGRRYNFGEKIG